MKKKRPIRIEGNIVYIPLTRGKEAIVDIDDIHIVEDFNWCAMKCLNTFYAIRNSTSIGQKKKTILMHREIIKAPPNVDVDHFSGDGLNNRRNNLRMATASQNGCNRGPQKNNRSGIKGVHWSETERKWKASIKINGKTKNVGTFDTAELAAAAYTRAAQELHGEFARTR